MHELTSGELATISGGLEKGTVCGFYVGTMVGASFMFGPLAGALVFMVTPLACALDYGLN